MGTRGPKRTRTKESCRESALQYKSRRQWELGDYGAERAAQKYGWIDFCCQHMAGKKQKPANYWTKQRCLERAKDFTSRKEWGVTCEGSYRKAVRNGWVEECAAHMDFAYGASDADVVYIWQDAESGLHKIGITSDRVGEQRIGICKATNRMDPRIVLMLKVGDARVVEKSLLELGTDPELDSSIDGYTEFRRLTDAELGKAVSIAYEAALAA